MKSHFTIKLAALLALTTIADARANSADSKWEALSSGDSFILVPEERSVELRRGTLVKPVNCSQFDRDIESAEFYLDSCKAGPAYSDRLCQVGMSEVDFIRYEPGIPDITDQFWYFDRKLSKAPEISEETKSYWARKLGVDPSRILIAREIALPAGPSPSLSIVPDRGSRALRFSTLSGKPIASPALTSDQIAIRTHGRDITCDLHDGRAEIALQQNAVITVEVQRASTVEQAWALRSKLIEQQARDDALKPGSLTEKAALFGARTAAFLIRENPAISEDQLSEQVGEAFDLLVDPTDLEFRPFENKEALRVSAYQRRIEDIPLSAKLRIKKEARQ